MDIAILGGGNGAYAASADFTEAGHSVRFWRRDTKAMKTLMARHVITIKDHRSTRKVRIHTVTPDIGDAVKGAQLILLPIPAFAQEDIARLLAPRLEDGQVLLLTPGTFGSFVMMKTLRSAGCQADVAIAEAGTLPYLARKHGSDCVAVAARATRLPTGVFPTRLSRHAFSVMKEAYPCIEECEDALSGALMNAGPIIHPPLIVMNCGPLEHRPGKWDIHNEGTQPSIRAVTDALDGERIRLRQALGYAAPHFPLANHYAPDAEEWMYGNAGHERLVESGDWCEPIKLTPGDSHRYMTEDVKLGLAFLASLGAWAGVPVPLAQAFLAICGAIYGEDFRRTGRTMVSLGLDGQSPSALQGLLQRGL